MLTAKTIFFFILTGPLRSLRVCLLGRTHHLPLPPSSYVPGHRAFLNNFDSTLLFLTVPVKSTANKNLLNLKSTEYGLSSRTYSCTVPQVLEDFLTFTVHKG